MKGLYGVVALMIVAGTAPAAPVASKSVCLAPGATLFGKGSELYISPAHSDGPPVRLTLVGLGWRPGERVIIYDGVPPNIDFGGPGAATVMADPMGRFRVVLTLYNPRPGQTTPLFMVAEAANGRIVTNGHTFAMAPFIFNY